MPDQRLNYVSGEWTASNTDETFETTDPANPDEVIATYPQSDAEDTERAIEAANEASDEWAETPGPERGRILTAAGSLLDQRTDELTELLVREEGKTWSEAGGEVQRAIDIFHYFGSKASDLGGTVKSSSARDTNLYTTVEPLGVAGLITPWNYPIAIPAWKIAPALAAGNTVVIKPATLAPGVVHEMAEALDEAGLPDGVLNVVTGPGSEVGSTIAGHEAVDAVSFTGSTAVGNTVYDTATEDGKRVQLEMGGKNPTIVSDSADVEQAADIVANGAFGVTGQACTAASRAIVHEDVYDEFVDAVVDRAAAIDHGHGLDDPGMGPHVSESELESTLEYVEIAQDEGATLEYGGSELDREGYYVEPAVFSDVDTEMRLAQEEVFGPVLAVIPVSDFDEAIYVANDVDYGLSASVVTDDHTEANRFVEEIEAGVVKINEKTTGLELHVPFGGMKDSSSETYREQGDAGLDFYTISKTVYDNY
ncbi:2,5-dioxovalerate dehydrogenase [Natrialba asiatica]|uniref:Aldehyde Dehydrogenase n=1 Tax=Natrialba asiatica (strain ATCC 700177 / DSM 12278 / JCM 9576 / FERM P-10747 / NBRC 102637 / 172P1) TaxID=29540 RepID=M0B6D7_NATA1|nr:aldehyde dehydrogenase family protein [Natrialba asiatica]ELZ06062.1 Aldehyde Dehydrogenase [Natrialba asiatica DSM 12278]